MLKACQTVRRAAPSTTKRAFIHSAGAPRHGAGGMYARPLLYGATAVLGAGSFWLFTQDRIHNDAVASPLVEKTTNLQAVSGVPSAEGPLCTLVWGSNRCAYVHHDIIYHLC